MRFRATWPATSRASASTRAAANTGTHIGNLWSNTGTSWHRHLQRMRPPRAGRQVNFATPVAITANTVLRGLLPHHDRQLLRRDSGYFAASYDNAPLHAVQDGSGGTNGVYRYGASAFPTSTYQSANYWVDVVFTRRRTTAFPAPSAARAATAPR